MNSAAFLLAINSSIAALFGTAFYVLAHRSPESLGRWCGSGYFFGALTALMNIAARYVPSEAIGSVLTFAPFMICLTLIAIGIARSFKRQSFISGLITWCVTSIAFYAFIGAFHRSGTLFHELSYQLPFSVTLTTAGLIVLLRLDDRKLNLALAIVLLLSALDFFFKGVLTAILHGDTGVHGYIYSLYALYSQTTTGILAVLLGLSLVGVMLSSIVEATEKTFERDNLSGLLTRAAFMKYAGNRIAMSQNSVLIMCDLDHFKSINDRFGHAAGDEAIRLFGQALHNYFGSDSVCGRLGGEEFCLVLTSQSLQDINAHMMAFRAMQRSLRYDLIPNTTTVTASFGIAVAHRDEPLSHLLKRADLALYDAKSSGRDCHRVSMVDRPLSQTGLSHSESNPAYRHRAEDFVIS